MQNWVWEQKKVNNNQYHNLKLDKWFFPGATYSIFCKKYVELHTLFNEGHVTDAHKLATRLFEATRMLFTEGYFKLTLRYAVNRLMKEKCGGKTLGNETKFVFLSEQDDKSAEKLTERLFTEYSDLLWNFNQIMDSFSLLSEIKKISRIIKLILK